MNNNDYGVERGTNVIGYALAIILVIAFLMSKGG